MGTEIDNQRPVCLLLPNWVSRRPDYEGRFVNPVGQKQHELFYLSPLEPYTYTMPPWVHRKDRPEHVGASGKTTPYLSSWYLVVPSSLSRDSSFLEKMDAVAKQQKTRPSSAPFSHFNIRSAQKTSTSTLRMSKKPLLSFLSMFAARFGRLPKL